MNESSIRTSYIAISRYETLHKEKRKTKKRVLVIAQILGKLSICG